MKTTSLLTLALILGVIAAPGCAQQGPQPVDESADVTVTAVQTPPPAPKHQAGPTTEEIFDRVESYYESSWQGFIDQVGIGIAILIGVATIVFAAIAIILPIKQSLAVRDMKAKISSAEDKAEADLKKSNEELKAEITASRESLHAMITEVVDKTSKHMAKLLKDGKDQEEKVRQATELAEALRDHLLDRTFITTANLFATHVAMLRLLGVKLAERAPSDLEGVLKPFLSLASNAIQAGVEANKFPEAIAAMFPAMLKFLETIPEHALVLEQKQSRLFAGAFLLSLEGASNSLQDAQFSAAAQELRSVFERKCKDQAVFLACIQAATPPIQE